MTAAKAPAGRGPVGDAGDADSVAERAVREPVTADRDRKRDPRRNPTPPPLDFAPPPALDPDQGALLIPSVAAPRPDAVRVRGLVPSQDGAPRDADGSTQEHETVDATASAKSPGDSSLPVAPLLYRPPELAAVLGISSRSLWRLDAAAKLPQAVRIGAAKRWRRAEIEAWIDAGCPARSAWDLRSRSNDQPAPRRSVRPSNRESNNVSGGETMSAHARTRGG
jgi:predicted DNA-binding transcriptional regulator AlpA